MTVLTDGKAFGASERDLLAANEIAGVEDRVQRLVHQGELLCGVELVGGRQIEADALFFNTGQRPHCSLPVKLGCAADEDRLGQTRERQKTDVPGLYLAGDADGDVQFVIVAAGEGATAAVAMNRELQDEDRQPASRE